MSIKDEAAKEIVKAAKDDPNVRSAGHELSKAALTVAKAVNVALLPLAVVNHYADKARAYFQTSLGPELAVKLPDGVVLSEPRASIAAPALQALAWAHDEPDLKEMYLNLLAGELTPSKQGRNHPGFVEIIRQLTAEEARVFRVFANAFHAMSVSVDELGDWHPDPIEFSSLSRAVGDAQLTTTRVVVVLENWVRLGLCRVDTDLTRVRHQIRGLMDAAPYSEMLHFGIPSDSSHDTVSVVMTAFGHQFAEAVGITEPKVNAPPSAPSSPPAPTP